MNIPKLLFTFALGLGLLTACSKSTAPKAETLPAANVHTEVVEARPYTITEQVMGTVRPKVRAALEAKIMGRIEKLPVVQGQRVTKGDLIAELDAREVRARLDQAIAVREQADRELKRLRALLAQQSTTQAEFDAVESRHQSAEASVAEAEAMLAYAKVSAPFDGIVSRKFVEVGDLAAPGKPLAEIEDSTSLRFEADVPEMLISRIQPGAKLLVTIPAMAKSFEATVSEIATFANSDSRTVLVKFDLPKIAGLRSGLFGQVEVPVKEARSVRVPASAVIERGQMEIAFVVTNDTVHLRLVKTGKRFDDSVEILSGIAAGESVVTQGSAKLIDGQPVARQ